MTNHDIVPTHGSAVTPFSAEYNGGQVPASTFRQRKAVRRANDRDLDIMLSARTSLVRESAGRAVDSAVVGSLDNIVSRIEGTRTGYMRDVLANAADEGGLVQAAADHYDFPPAYTAHMLGLAEGSQKAAVLGTTRTLLGAQDRLAAGVLDRH